MEEIGKNENKKNIKENKKNYSQSFSAKLMNNFNFTSIVEGIKNLPQNIKKNLFDSYQRRLFVDRYAKHVLFFCGSFSAIVVFFITLFLFIDAYPLFETVNAKDFFFGTDWRPTRFGQKKYESGAIIAGTFLVTFGAMAISVPLGIGSAIFLSEFCPPKIKDTLKTGVELLSGIPSVIYGWFGLIMLTTWLRVTFDQPTGQSWIAGSILLGIMSLPTIVSVSEDAISSVPREMKEASLALGATRWQTVSKVLFPASFSGITAAIILGMGRAIGETMAVMMVTGNAAIIPKPLSNIFSPIRTLTGNIGTETGEVPIGSVHYHALYMQAVVLFAIILLINTAATKIMKGIKDKNYGISACDVNKSCSIPVTDKTFLEKLKDMFYIKQDYKDVVNEYFPYVLKSMGVLFLVWLFISWFGYIFGIIIVILLFLFKYASRKMEPVKFEKIAVGIVASSAAVVIFFLLLILYYVVINGLPELSWEFISKPPRSIGRQDGIYPAIMGTLYLTMGAMFIGLPLGIGAGIYLSEYAKEDRIIKIVRSGIDYLNGTPSIVFGLFGYTVLVIYFGLGRSLIAGMIILGLLVLPTIIRTTEEAMKTVPQSFREGSLALGATKWETIKKVVLPSAKPGIMTGAILSIGRAAGETAPILFTAATFMQRRAPSSLSEPVMAIPYFIYMMSTEVPGGIGRASGAALVLIIIVLSMYGSASVIRKRFKRALG